jgi:hypothetical protein
VSDRIVEVLVFVEARDDKQAESLVDKAFVRALGDGQIPNRNLYLGWQISDVRGDE